MTRGRGMAGLKEDPRYRADASGVLKLRKEPDPPTARLDSDYSLRLVLQGRAPASDLANACRCSVTESWTANMLAFYMRDPPAGYARASVEQLLRADLYMF